MPPKDDNASQSDMGTFVGYDFRRITFLDIMRSDELLVHQNTKTKLLVFKNIYLVSRLSHNRQFLVFYGGLISKHVVVGKDKKYICSIMYEIRCIIQSVVMSGLCHTFCILLP